MIRLHQFKRQWGIANPSPFCMKVETYLRMTGLAYEVIEEASPLNAPKKKLPYIDDGEKVIPDSGFIIDYLKASYGNPLDGGLSRAQQDEAHLMRRLCEESLLWPVVYSRWIDAAGGASSNRPSLAPCLPCCGTPCPGSRNGASNACFGCKAWAVTGPRRSIASASRISRRSPPA